MAKQTPEPETNATENVSADAADNTAEQAPPPGPAQSIPVQSVQGERLPLIPVQGEGTLGKVAQAMAAAAPVRTRKEMRLDPDKGRYVEVEVPIDEVRAYAVSEPGDAFVHDPLGLGPAWEEGRGRVMHARWVPKNQDRQSIERGLGYAPVHAEDFPGHRFVNDRNNITHGDLILMEIPREMDERRQARRLDAHFRERDEMAGGKNDELADRANSIIPGAAEFAPDAEDFDVQNEREIGGMEAFGPAPSAADMEAEMELAAEMDRGRVRGRSTFGGLQGSPTYNRTGFDRPNPAVLTGGRR